jgi:PAS domain S-box-containing protein
MVEEKDKQLITFRQPAEAAWQGQPVSPEEMQTLLHELQVRQIELERQNENLRQAHNELEQRMANRTAELHQERNFVSAVLETASALIVVLDRQGRIVRFNRTCEQLTGYTFEEVCGKQVWDLLLLPEEAEVVKAVFAQLLTGHFPNKHENYWVARDGSRRLIAWSNTALPDAEGSVEYVIGTGIDITERKQAQEEIERSRRWLERIAQTTPDIIFVLDIINNRNVYTNRSILEILGYSPEEFGQLPDILQKAIDAEDLVQAEEFYRRMANAKPGEVRFLTHRTLHKDGTIRWIENRVTPFTWDENGHLREVIGLAHDITERKRLEEALKTHGRVLDNMAEGVLVADEDDFIYFTNPAFDAMFGYEPGELSGQHASILNLDPIATAALFAIEINQALRSAGVWSGEFNNRKKDGAPFITAAHISLLELQDKIYRVSVQEDITERKQMEAEKDRLLQEVSQQREQLRKLAQQLAAAEEAERKQLARELHDQVGSNLTALGLNLNIIQGQIPAAHPEMDSVQARLNDARALVEQTTERIRDVMTNLHPPVLDDYGLVAALRWYVNRLAARVPFTITVQGQEPSPRMADVVEYTLFRVTQEALTNVIKHAQATQVIIKVETDDQAVQLSISDDGFGFEPDQAKGIDRPGWGLLTMAERAERIGGCCLIESEPGQGARITVKIPR